MHFSRTKVIFALFPFVVTLLAIGIFLLFFYQNTVVFSAPTAFEISYHNHTYLSVDNKVSLIASAGEQTFVASQTNYEPQTITLDIPWYKATQKVIGLRFIPQISPLQNSVVPTLSVANTISDTVTLLSQSGSALPDLKPYSRLVMSLDGKEACFFSVNGAKALHWQANSNQLTVLPEGTIECAISDTKVTPVVYKDQHIQVGLLNIPITLPNQWQLLASPYEQALLVMTHATNESKRVQLISQDGVKEIGIFDGAQARFINKDLWALKTTQATLIFKTDQQIAQLSSLIPIQSLLAAANPLNDGTDIYYISKQKDLSLNQLLENTPPSTQLIRLDSKTRETTVMYTFPTETIVSGSRIDTSAATTLLYNVLTPSAQLLRVQIGPQL